MLEIQKGSCGLGEAPHPALWSMKETGPSLPPIIFMSALAATARVTQSGSGYLQLLCKILNFE